MQEKFNKALDNFVDEILPSYLSYSDYESSLDDCKNQIKEEILRMKEKSERGSIDINQLKGNLGEKCKKKQIKIKKLTK